MFDVVKRLCYRVAQVFEPISLFWRKQQQQQTDKQDLLSLVWQIVKLHDTRNLEIVVGSCEHPILPAFQS